MIEVLENYVSNILKMSGDSDFHMISLIRFLYLANDSGDGVIEIAKDRILAAMINFPYWPSDCHCNRQMDSIVFWSENHLLMTLSSCFLLRQYMSNSTRFQVPYSDEDLASGCEGTLSGDDNEIFLPDDFESRLLLVYLRVHLDKRFHGFYETHSIIYLPYTASSLLNLLDFSLCEPIRRASGQLLNLLGEQVARVALSSIGVCNIAGMAIKFTIDPLKWIHFAYAN